MQTSPVQTLWLAIFSSVQTLLTCNKLFSFRKMKTLSFLVALTHIKIFQEIYTSRSDYFPFTRKEMKFYYHTWEKVS